MAKRNSFALIRSPQDAGSIVLHQHQRAAEAFARLASWHPITQITLSDGSSYFISEDGELHSALKAMGPNAQAWTPSLDHIAASPKAFRIGLPRLLGQGTTLHVGDLGGPISQHWDGLMRGWMDAEPLEQQLAEERKEKRDQAARYQSVLEQWQREFQASMVARYGLPAEGLGPVEYPDYVLEAFPAQVEQTAAQPDDEAQDLMVGAYLRTVRERRGMTQSDIATVLGVTPSAVSRLESSGHGPQLVPTIKLIAPHLMPAPDIVQLVGEDNVGAIIRANASRYLIADIEQEAAEQAEPEQAAAA